MNYLILTFSGLYQIIHVDFSDQIPDIAHKNSFSV